MQNEDKERAKAEASDLIARYQKVFGTEDGKAILKDLDEVFLWQDSRPHVQAGNALGVVYMDAQRMLLRYIRSKVTRPVDEQLAVYDLDSHVNQGDPLHAGPGHHGYF